MKIRMAPVLVVVAALLAGAAAAAPKEAKRQSISLDRPALVGGTVLPAGSYQLELIAGTDTARFVQRDRIVAEVPCKVGFAQVIYSGNAVHYRTGESGPDRLIKIVLASSKLAIVFPSESGAAQAAF
jgi:hypothetical protein